MAAGEVFFQLTLLTKKDPDRLMSYTDIYWSQITLAILRS